MSVDSVNSRYLQAMHLSFNNNYKKSINDIDLCVNSFKGSQMDAFSP